MKKKEDDIWVFLCENNTCNSLFLINEIMKKDSYNINYIPIPTYIKY